MTESTTRLGKYEIRKVLGRGAMAVVYVAYDPVLEREVAVKVIASAILSEDELRQRFEREAKAIARLQHPNIVTIYDLGYDDAGSPFIAMELLKGCDLEQKIRQATLSVPEKLNIVMQACRALAHAHENGIVHRDIKPANVFVTETAVTKIMDFGVARWAHSSQTQTGQILGTAEYMPPEQIEGEELDGRADIFSLGVILYQLLTHKKPFTGQDFMAIFYQIVNVDPPEVVLPSGERIPALQAIVRRAIAKNAADRYQSAAEFADDIKSFARNQGGTLAEATLSKTGADLEFPTSTGATAPATTLRPRAAGRRTVVMDRAPAAPPTEVHREPPRQNHAPLFVASGLALLLAAGAGSLWYLRRPPEPQATPVAGAGTSVENLGARFELAQNLLENGKISEAYEAVNRILEIDPGNARAVALKEEIMKVSTERLVTATPPPIEDKSGAAVAPSAPSPNVSAQKALEVSRALSRGDLEGAEALLKEGEKLDPSSSRWKELQRELEEKKRDAEDTREKAAKTSAALERATSLLGSGEFDQAIAVYGEVLKLDPGNAAAATGLTQATALKAQRAMAAMARPRFTESETEFIPAAGPSSGPTGFAVDGVDVKNGTAGAKFPAQILIEHVPEAPQPGQPYVLRVRLHNSGQRPIQIKSLELVSSLGSRPPMGRGLEIRPQVGRVDVQATAILHEVQGVWTEEQKRGSIQATVFLVGNDKLVKTTKW